MTPQQRSRNLLTEEGWSVATVEHWCSFTRRRKDLFNFGDLFAVKAGHPPKIIQVTSGSNVASRITKIASIPESRACILAGIEIEVHGWRKLKRKRGSKATYWAPRIVTVHLKDLDPCQQGHSPDTSPS